MDEEEQSVIARNEALFREINEGIERGQWPGEEDAPVGFRCECARLGCNELIELTVRQYERVRADPRRFVVAPGHELPDGETVVDSGGGYVVVEKRDQAGATAEGTDPRS
ncbi:MAG: hypothetical protein JOZ98_04235 [Solirubrobacterales bacterium]|nr:hypothetical protein [Solirubrobacterales bacterium]MBV9422093.1 hypothetical protein [Solirubrobacterales bacterium]MBV9800041.1 hypothetical protein [Solirubrobacterales bacterium]